MRISDWSSDVCSSDLVRARLQHLGDVVAVVEDGLAIIGPAWIEQRGGGLAPVDAELVMAEPADRDDRMANGLADSEAAPEQRHHLGAGIVGALARFGDKIGRASWGEGGWQAVSVSGVDGRRKK